MIKILERACKIPINKTQLLGVTCRISGIIFSFGGSVLLARILQPEMFGLYSYLTTIAEVLTVFALFGTPTLILREVAIGIANNLYSNIRGVIVWSKKFVGTLSIILTIVCFIALLLVQKKNNQNTSTLCLLFATMIIPVDSLKRQNTSVLQGLNKIFLSQVLSTISGPGILFLLLTILYFMESSYHMITTVLGFVFLSRLISLILSEILKKKYLPCQAKKMPPTIQIRRWFKSAFPLLGVSIMLIINTRIDIIMLGFMTDTSDIGIYRIAQRGAEILLIGVLAIDSELNPIVAKALSRNEKSHLQTIVTKSIWSVLLFSLPIAIIFFFGGKQLVSYAFGVEYINAWLPLVILSIGYLSLGFLGRGGIMLSMSHFEGITFLSIGIGCVTNIIINLLLIPKYGINGAAISTAASVTVRMIIEAYFAFRYTGINTTIFYYMTHKKNKTIIND